MRGVYTGVKGKCGREGLANQGLAADIQYIILCEMRNITHFIKHIHLQPHYRPPDRSHLVTITSTISRGFVNLDKAVAE